MSLLDKSVVLLPPYATKSIYMVVKEFEHKGTAKVRLRHPETGSEHAKPVSQIRIAEDAEIAAGHRIEPHEAFQEWFKTQPFYSDLLIQFGDAIFDFERVDQSYRKLPVNIAWITWQQNSVEVYRLKLWYKNVKLQLENKEIDAVNDAKKIDELQKRVDELENTQSRFELKAEEAECVSICLDDHGVAKCDQDGNSYSLWGRVCQFKKTSNFTEDDLERIYWEFDSERAKKGEERLRFKEALRGLLEQALKGGAE